MSEASPEPMFDLESAIKARQEGRSVPITSFSVEEAVERGIFRFAPPLIERSPKPKMLYQEWRAFQVVFDDIADPRTFPPLPSAPPADDLSIFDRYIDAAEELAESQLLCGSDRVTVRWRAATDTAPESEEVESRFTPKENARGFAVLLRQFDSQTEAAGFQPVSDHLRTLSAEMIDSHEQRRVEQIDSWRRARGKLHGTELHRLTIRKIAPAMEYGNEHPPTRYLSAVNYTDLIHWYPDREPVGDLERIAWVEAARSLAYLYIGFSELVRAAIGDAALA